MNIIEAKEELVSLCKQIVDNYQDLETRSIDIQSKLNDQNQVLNSNNNSFNATLDKLEKEIKEKETEILNAKLMNEELSKEINNMNRSLIDAKKEKTYHKDLIL